MGGHRGAAGVLSDWNVAHRLTIRCVFCATPPPSSPSTPSLSSPSPFNFPRGRCAVETVNQCLFQRLPLLILMLIYSFSGNDNNNTDLGRGVTGSWLESGTEGSNPGLALDSGTGSVVLASGPVLTSARGSRFGFGYGCGGFKSGPGTMVI